MSIQIDDETGRVTYLGTGIGTLEAAKHYLKEKFSQLPAEKPVSRPGARFYVSAVAGSRDKWVPVCGPYASHMVAQMNVPAAKAVLRAKGMGAACFALGTCSSPETLTAKFGRGQSS